MAQRPDHPAHPSAPRSAAGRIWLGLLAAFALGIANWWLWRIPFVLVAPWEGIMILAGMEAFVLALAVRDWAVVPFAPLAMWAGFLAIMFGFSVVSGYVSGPYYWGITAEIAGDMLVLLLVPALVGAAIGMALITGVTWRRPA